MGLDVGDAHIGVALSDPLGIIAQPYAIVETKGKRSIQSVISIVAEQDVRTIVVGMPYELSGDIGPQGEKVKRFADDLQAALLRRKDLKHVAVKLWDERMTTVQAKRVLAGSGLKDKESHTALDRISAAVILGSYLESLPTVTSPKNGEN